MNKQLLIAAREYKKLGISPIPTDSNKRSTIQWKKYQEAIATDIEIGEMFYDNDRVLGIATLCGKVSGGLEVVDLDAKYDTTGTLYADYVQAVMDHDPAIIPKLVIATTKGGGYHLMYRCDEIGGNVKLAGRHTTEAERKDNPHEKVKVLIETRGEAGYVIAVPTPGYAYIQNSVRNLPRITPQERLILLDVARSFNQVKEEAQPPVPYVENKTFNKSPFTDYNERGDVVELLIKHGWKFIKRQGDKSIMLRPGETTSKSSGDYNHELGMFSVFSTSTEFEVNKGYRPAAVLAILEFGNDWKKLHKHLINNGYGERYLQVVKDVRRSVEKMQDKGIGDDKIIAAIVTEFSMTIEDAKKNLETINNAGSDAGNFWQWSVKKNELTLTNNLWADFLNDNGFGLYFTDKLKQNYKVVHDDHGRLEEVTNERIKKFVQAYIAHINLEGRPYTNEMLLEMVYIKSLKLFSSDTYDFLKPRNPDFLNDTHDAAFIPFTNGIVKVTKNDVQLLKHGSINKVIWKSDVIDFNVDIDIDKENTGCEYYDFLCKVAGIEHDNDLAPEKIEQLNYIISIVGYLLHKYKHPAKAFAVILAEETDDEAKGGGTGKGIFIKGLEKLLNTVTIDGKNFKPDKSFAWQRVNLDTKLIALQDVERNFPFEKLYSTLTEGMTVEKKNQMEIFLSYDQSGKIIITTNYSISDDGNHAKRRQKTVEFSSFFGASRSPEDVYGHLLFNDWDKDEWNRFYNFMFLCLKYYLENGIASKKQGSSYKSKKIKTAFGEEFLSWFEDYKKPGNHEKAKFNSVYLDFLNLNNFDKKDYSIRRFKKAVIVASENFGFYTCLEKSPEENNTLYVSLISQN